LRARIDAYFGIVVRNVRDSVPKAIGYFLVRSVQEKMQYFLYSEIMKNVEILDSLGEVYIDKVVLASSYCRRKDYTRKNIECA